MKKLFQVTCVVIAVLMAHFTTSYGGENEAYDSAIWKAHVFMTGDDATFLLDESTYDGVVFPHYYGYFGYNENTFFFTKKTELPYKYVTEIFESVRDNGYIVPRSQSMYFRAKVEYDYTKYYTHDPWFLAFLMDYFLEHREAIIIEFEGRPGDAPLPVFTESCIYDSSKERYCKRNDFTDLRFGAGGRKVGDKVSFHLFFEPDDYIESIIAP